MTPEQLLYNMALAQFAKEAGWGSDAYKAVTENPWQTVGTALGGLGGAAFGSMAGGIGAMPGGTIGTALGNRLGAGLDSYFHGGPSQPAVPQESTAHHDANPVQTLQQGYGAVAPMVNRQTPQQPQSSGTPVNYSGGPNVF